MSTQQPRILALHPDVQPPNYIIESEICLIGRSTMCQIVISRGTVSRLHAKIEREGPRFMISDANSANGTFINGQRIREPHLLEADDMIGLSNEIALLRFEDPDTTIRLIARLRYDIQQMKFYLDEKPVGLTPTQLSLLLHLYQHADSVCTRKSCAEAIWQRDYDPNLDADALDKIVSNLRKKLHQVDPEADLIETRRGVGYVLNL